MSKTRDRLTKGIGIFILVVVVGLFGLLVFNERNLRNNRSEREPMQHLGTLYGDGVEVDETEVTEEMRDEWVVAADRPRFLSIERLGIVNARVLEVGILDNGEMATPVNIFDTAWYRMSALPGQSGAMLVNGHNGGPTLDGVFKRLGELANGDEIVIERGDGEIFVFAVVENRVVNMDEARQLMGAMMESAEAGREGLNLITCIGEWIPSERTFDQRVFLRAVRIL
ncbi:class F sortase [Candidatus Saccharibacteria bacterium]|nr:class F sortase [Candidatus Saccharibacteria bacterium]